MNICSKITLLKTLPQLPGAPMSSRDIKELVLIPCYWSLYLDCTHYLLNSTQLNSKVFISSNIQYRSIATWEWNPHWFICPITIEFKKFNLVTSVLNTNCLVHVHTQKHTQNVVADKYFRKKQIFSHMWIGNIDKKVQKCIHSGYSLVFNNSFLASLTHCLIKAETKWWPFRRRYFQMHFLQLKCFNFDYNFTEVCS